MRRLIKLFKEPFWTEDFHIFDIYQPSNKNNEFLQEHDKMVSFSDISWDCVLH